MENNQCKPCKFYLEKLRGKHECDINYCLSNITVSFVYASLQISEGKTL
jgi:hypothetical protein